MYKGYILRGFRHVILKVDGKLMDRFTIRASSTDRLDWRKYLRNVRRYNSDCVVTFEVRRHIGN